MSPYEVAVGLRYTRARKGSGRNSFISFIALISMAGIALGVAALIVVLSVMNGFQQRAAQPDPVRRVAHRSPRLSGPARIRRRARRRARQNPRVVATAPYVTGQAMLASGDVNRGTLLRGIDPAQEATVADIGLHMRARRARRR